MSPLRRVHVRRPPAGLSHGTDRSPVSSFTRSRTRRAATAVVLAVLATTLGASNGAEGSTTNTAGTAARYDAGLLTGSQGTPTISAVATTPGRSSATGPAQATGADEEVAVPKTAWVHLDGHGWGHGRGMSQYGAGGQAAAGRSWQQILSYYYPGTTRTETQQGADRRVKVLLTADSTSDVVVSHRSRLRVHDLVSNRVRQLPTTVQVPDADGERVTVAVRRWRLWVNPRKKLVLQHQTRATGTWRWRWYATMATDPRTGHASARPGAAEFYAGGAPITLHTPAGATPYRGRIRSAPDAANPTRARSRDTVNVISLENYLRGVVPREIPASWPRAAVSAQAVAARTYAIFERSEAPADRPWQICDTAHCQVYGGAAAEHPASDAAIRETARIYLSWQGQPAFTQFTSSNGGWSVNGGRPYLPAREDPTDAWSANPNHDWSARVSDTTIEAAWPTSGELTSLRVTSRDGNGEWGGRVRQIQLTGINDGRQVRLLVSGSTFRSALSLKETWFTVTGTSRR